MILLNLLIYFIFLLNVCYIKNVEAKKIKEHLKTPFLYGNFSYVRNYKKVLEEFCFIAGKSLKCGKEYVRNGNTTKGWEKTLIDAVFINLNITHVLKKDQLLVGREASIVALTFSNNSITFVESQTFDRFISLQILNFWNTNLTTIDETVLTKILGSHLLFLNLNDNNISFLSTSAFKYLTRLYQLSLDGNQNVGKFINNGIFPKSLKELEWLYLTNCNITLLNDDIFANLTGLKYLMLSKNPFTSVPKAINIIPKLFMFSFAFTNIKSIQNDKEIYNKHLQVFALPASKELLEIGDCGFCNFPNLSSLDFTLSSKLSSIHSNAFGSKKDIPDLMDVKMESCNITSLPKNILKRRLRLYLADNPINNDGIITVNV